MFGNFQQGEAVEQFPFDFERGSTLHMIALLVQHRNVNNRTAVRVGFFLKNFDRKAVFNEPRERFARAEVEVVNRLFFARGLFDLLFRLRLARTGQGDDDGFLFAERVFDFPQKRRHFEGDN